jgi:hypothetical protein
MIRSVMVLLRSFMSAATITRGAGTTSGLEQRRQG